MSVEHRQVFVGRDDEGDEFMTITEDSDGNFELKCYSYPVSRQELIELFSKFIEAYEEQGIILPAPTGPTPKSPYDWPPLSPTFPGIQPCIGDGQIISTVGTDTAVPR